MRLTTQLRLVLAGLLTLASGLALAETPAPPPVAAVVDGRLAVDGGQLPVFTSQDWSRPLPNIHRVVIVVHGYERNAADYARNMLASGPPTDTLVVAPQFLAPEDVAAHQLPDATLRWNHELWSGGNPAIGPVALSAFDAFDTILAKLADRRIFPGLSQAVLAGFSAGGQVVQRYAIVGKGEQALIQNGIRLRYIVGSPSSFTYFGDERPLPNGTLAAFTGAAMCPGYNRWKYGFAGDMPPYVSAAASMGVPALETRYALRDVVYLVGGADADPNHKYLDKSCAAEAEGQSRLARTKFFFAAMKSHAPAILRHRMWIIDGAAHNAAKVLGSPCGRAALFDEPGCTGS
jgi:pimeloyl-ACP methyl ester carboxylesterase